MVNSVTNINEDKKKKKNFTFRKMFENILPNSRQDVVHKSIYIIIFTRMNKNDIPKGIILNLFVTEKRKDLSRQPHKKGIFLPNAIMSPWLRRRIYWKK